VAQKQNINVDSVGTLNFITVPLVYIYITTTYLSET